ncbi:aminotransferase [Sporanaerobium hydrogeniformans]|uniref:Aminotransferase n=1 Tax=Sporanaerobium hydrogeniformans TaxID=3072179 RepID=A0AC61DCL7_9FIRM|nr:MalY/PatB family protein [Sporanaerobium hydrogeniformans]PHV70528.1 aminotransferase [Sporanaerobium hydrogeniformans]
MKYNFDELINRSHTNSIKYDFIEENGKPVDILPLWVADMDFQTLPEIREALIKVSEHGIYGYSEQKNDYFLAVASWYERRFGWKVEPSWLVKTPGVVYAIAVAIRALTQENDAVMIQEPVYYPFAKTIKANNRRLIKNELIYRNNKYTMDFETLEKQIITNKVKLLVLCSPHNPVGRVWTKEELSRLGDICIKHNVYIVADEIHSDFVYEGHEHSIFANIKPEYAQHTITCTAPSKTFNLAGLQVSNIFIQDKMLREQFKKELQKNAYSQLNIMGLKACEVAYTYGEEWLEELKRYLFENLAFVRCFLERRLPELKLVEPEGTYLVWIDCNGLGLNPKVRQDLIVNKAKLWLDEGALFGKSGEDFERINIACPRQILEKALIQLEGAILQVRNKT